MRMEHTTEARRTSWLQVLATVALLVTAVPAFASAASAQVCDPVYGCPPVTEPGTTPPSCTINASTVAGGETVTVSVTDLTPAAAFQVTLDGVVRANGVADASGNANVSFTAPSGLSESSHPVFVVGAGFSADCGALVGAAVQAGVIDDGSTTTTAAVGGAGVGAGRAVQGGSLARTGLEVGLLLAIAACLIVVGQRLLAVRRRRLRRRNDVASLTPPVTTSH
jgi:hypothetical protein